VQPARRGAALARAALAAVSAAGCGRLFADAGWVAPVAFAVGGALAVGAVLDRRPAVAAKYLWAAHGAGLALLLAEAVGGHTAYGIPTPATVASLLRVAGRAPDGLRSAIVPAPVRPELLVWVLPGLWLATALADGLARRRRAGLAAVVPLAVFPVVVAALGTARWRAPLTFAFAATTALYAALTRAAALPTAGGRPPRTAAAGGAALPGAGAGPARPAAARRPMLLSRHSALAARRLKRAAAPPTAGRPARSPAGVAALVGVAAVVLGPVVPGIGAAVVDVHALGVTLDVSRIELNPLVDIRPQLLTARPAELFTVRAPAPAYWRLTALDRFDGRLWSPSRPALLRRHGPSAGGGPGGDRALAQEIRVSALDSPWLPAAGRAVRVEAAGTRLDPETDSLVTRRGSRAVRAYRVESRLPADRPARPGPAAAAPAVPRPDLGRYLALPARFPPEVRALAEEFTAGAATPFDRALALEDSLRVRFIYDETAPPGTSVDALENFLFVSHRGYCEQFAGAYAAMARAVGLPARVAVGFTPGRWDEPSGAWRVTTREAHAWPEVFLDGIGWTAFEPTPGRVLPRPETERRARADSARPADGPAGGGGRTAAAPARIDPGAPAGPDAGPGGRPATLARSVVHRPLAWLALAGLGLGLAPPLAKRRRRARRRRAGGDAAVLGAWRETLDRLAEAGLAHHGPETPTEFAERAGAARPGAARPLRHLAALVNRAAYGRSAAAGEDSPAPGEAWADADRVTRALDDHDAVWLRLRRRIDPRPLLRR